MSDAARSRLAGPASLLLVGTVFAALIATAGTASHAGALRLAAAPATTASLHADRATSPSYAAQPDIAAALAVFGRPGRATHHVSRSHPRAPLHQWVRPFWGMLSSPFGMRWGRLHPGIDLAGPWGSDIVAATDGCIESAGWESGYGQLIEIADWDGTETVYAHMSSFVRTGGCVKAGQVIGHVGMTGDATGPHLHFEVRVGGAPIDPIPFLAKRGVYI